MGKVATTPAAARSLAQREELQRKQQLADFQALMNTHEGRRVVWRFLERAAVFGSAFNTNAMTQSHNIGWQDAGKWWLQEIEGACPEKFQVMAIEARKAAKLAAAEQQQQEDNDE
jgi:hypothetical protein